MKYIPDFLKDWVDFHVMLMRSIRFINQTPHCNVGRQLNTECMNNPIIIVLAMLCATTTLTFAQGTLTPPGAPSPTMKSLDQVEPRVPISAEEFFIGTPGSYYLTGNLTGASAASPYGIYISSDNVTIDLNGFTVQGGPGSIHGIFVSGSFTNIVIKNGIITGWAQNGVDCFATSQNVTLEHLSISGCQSAGIFLGGSDSVVIDNILEGNNAGNNPSSAGILIEGSNNRIENNHVTNSGSGGNGTGYGIEAFSGSGNIFIKNSVEGNPANNYSIASGNDAGLIGSAATSTSPWANFSH